LPTVKAGPQNLANGNVHVTDIKLQHTGPRPTLIQTSKISGRNKRRFYVQIQP
jgi:hypothetical protein